MPLRAISVLLQLADSALEAYIKGLLAENTQQLIKEIKGLIMASQAELKKEISELRSVVTNGFAAIEETIGAEIQEIKTAMEDQEVDQEVIDMIDQLKTNIQSSVSEVKSKVSAIVPAPGQPTDEPIVVPAVSAPETIETSPTLTVINSDDLLK